MSKQKIILVIALSSMHYESVKPTVAHLVENYDPHILATATVSDRVTADFPNQTVTAFGIDNARNRRSQRARGAAMFNSAGSLAAAQELYDPDDAHAIVFLSRPTSMMSDTVAGFAIAAAKAGALVQYVKV